MFRAPDYWHNMSLRLTSVLEDIGVNGRLVLKRRRTYMLTETLETISSRLIGKNVSCYHFGSQTEGSTTIGLQSDLDTLVSNDNINVIQDMSEWTKGLTNLLMTEDTAPGYCFLQRIYDNVPQPLAEIPDKHCSLYKGRVIVKNTKYNFALRAGDTRQGPAFSAKRPGFVEGDYVPAFPCKSLPTPVIVWLNQLTNTGQISPRMKRYIENSKCYVVPVGRKDSEYEEYEWRISTSHAERCIMFNFNLTQLHCYVLMKIILKTFLTYKNIKAISSFICKNILLLCINHIAPGLWQPQNLLHLLTLCLFSLRRCVLLGHCPHFILHRNNLLALKITTDVRLWLYKNITFVMQNFGRALLAVEIDDIGIRLANKLNVVNDVAVTNYRITTEGISKYTSGTQMYHLATILTGQYMIISHAAISGSTDHHNMLKRLAEIYHRGSHLERTVCLLLTPLFCSTVGSLSASNSININNPVSHKALTWLSVGLNSDVASGRLKLATVFYCVGDLHKTEILLREIEDECNKPEVEGVCGCYGNPTFRASDEFCEFANIHDGMAVRHITALCARFLPSEKKNIPKELQYEMFRSTKYELLCRKEFDFWMDWAVIDSLPYTYFLQYKTYGRLHSYEAQQQALVNLVSSIFTTRNLGHRETCLNLLGQCMVQENRHKEALQYYTMSLNIRPQQNVARLHVCRLISSLLRKRSSMPT